MNDTDRVRVCTSSLERDLNTIRDRLRGMQRELDRVDRRIWQDNRFQRPQQNVKSAITDIGRSADRLRDQIRQLDRATR